MHLLLYSAGLAVSLTSLSISQNEGTSPLKGSILRTSTKVTLPSTKHELMDPSYSEEKRRRVTPIAQRVDSQVTDEMKLGLKQRADTLVPLVQQMPALLEKIETTLEAKARIQADPLRSSQLGGMTGVLRQLRGDANGILRNLRGYAAEGENPTANMGVAILASGFLTSQLDKLIPALSSHEDTKDIDLAALKAAKNKLSSFTQALPNFPLQQYDD
ncbi:MAG: hypothetical protein FJX71_06580 [Alphaproteobacteria bacterium]|nr:hypothetical protein [Alphaproteobacteria bacterium]